MEMLYREMDSRLAYRGANTAFVTREQLKDRDKTTLDVDVQFVPEFSKRALMIVSDVCVFADGIARPGATLRDFAAEDARLAEAILTRTAAVTARQCIANLNFCRYCNPSWSTRAM